MNSLPIGSTVNETTINNLRYADDMVLISPSVQSLQLLIDTCHQYAEEFDIIYNETKTQCMSLLLRSFKHIAEPQIFLGNHRLEYVDEFPYLDHIITNDLKDTADIEQRRRKPCATGDMIIRRALLQREPMGSSKVAGILCVIYLSSFGLSAVGGLERRKSMGGTIKASVAELSR
ncbi:uncharacterized protein LOC135202924 [Macrobrachium nipponense]|uniref:uncharacterized protein LOC135202924 n=1 Tax=Macrobrachium nipponense TaxID=159736 RepID=UPI0030C8B1BD